MKDLNTAYVEDMLYLPKTKVRKAGIIGALEFKVFTNRKPETIQLWSETPTHIAVPKFYIPASNYSKYPFKVEVNTPSFQQMNFVDNILLRENQIEAWCAFLNAKNGLLNLAPGKGKTVLALKKVAVENVPALIVVHNTYLKDQWIERIQSFLGVGDIGIIQGPVFDWKKPICVAMINTLADRVSEGRIPPEMREWFGIAIYDEAHHLGAQHFSKTATVCNGMRIGLTATPERSDGLDCIYRYNIGPIIYTDTEYNLVPEILFQETPVEMDLKSKEVIDKRRELNIPMLMSAVGKKDESIEFRYKHLKQAYDEGRKIIALSQSKEQLRLLAPRFKDSCLIIQETDPKERTRMVAESKIAFVISKLGLEGLDDMYLDTLFFLSPMGADKKIGPNGIEFLGNRVTQGFGRILRTAEKKSPLVVFFDDVKIEPLHYLCNQVKRFLNSKEMKFTTRKAD